MNNWKQCKLFWEVLCFPENIFEDKLVRLFYQISDWSNCIKLLDFGVNCQTSVKNFCEILCKNLDPIARVTELFLQLIIKPKKFSVKFPAKVEIQKNFWELGSQDPILSPPLTSMLIVTISLISSKVWYKYLSAYYLRFSKPNKA